MVRQTEYVPSEQETALLEYVKANAGTDGWCRQSLEKMVKGLGLERPRDLVRQTSGLYMNDLLDIDIDTGHLRVVQK